MNGPNPQPRRCEVPGCRHRAARQVGERHLCIDHGHEADHAARLAAPVEVLTGAASVNSAAPLPPCDPCASRRVVLAEEEGVVVARRCPACDLPCAVCKGVGTVFAVRNGYEGQRPCGCGVGLYGRAVRALTAARMPGAYARLLFGELPTPSFPLTDSQRRAHVLAQGWAGKYVAGQRPGLGLFFHGPPGTGKTLALCRLLAAVARKRGGARYVHLPSYLDARKGSFGSGASVEAVADLAAAPVLVVDEILLQGRNGQARSLTEWERAQFELLLHERALAGYPTHFATNYSPAQIEAEVSESTWSRLRSTVHQHEVTGPDLRQRSTHRSSQ
jgi:hypothetical protein